MIIKTISENAEVITNLLFVSGCTLVLTYLEPIYWYSFGTTEKSRNSPINETCHRETFKTAHDRKRVRNVTAEITGLVKNSNLGVYLTTILWFCFGYIAGSDIGIIMYDKSPGM